MEVKDFILKSLESMQRILTMTISDLEADELKWRPGPQANSIGFILWHQLRVEDAFIHSVLQQKPQVYEQEKWHQKMGLPDDPDDTGGGYTAVQVAAFPVPGLDTLRQYGDAVRRQTIDYINNLEPDGLDRALEHARLGKITVGGLIILLFGELYQHIGQIAYLRGLVRSSEQQSEGDK